jgi:alpha-1,6-mannosyltransferase
MKICDLTQFYSPVSGGVKRYVHEKIAFIQRHRPDDEHVLIVPGEKTESAVDGRSRIYTIHSPLISRRSRYRALLNLRAVGEILERENPDIIESSDPYQVAWKAISAGAALRRPVIAYYHSHFPEIYERSVQRFFGQAVAKRVGRFLHSYVRNLYSRFQCTLAPSETLAETLTEWGVRNVRALPLGVDTAVFRPEPNDRIETRKSLGIPAERELLLYVGRLSSDKNVRVLFEAFDLVEEGQPGRFHLLVVGDGPMRQNLISAQREGGSIAWIRYVTDSAGLARLYRAADLFVHPGVHETFGLVALESQACGTPVVGIRGSRMDRIIQHGTDAWAGANSPRALAQAIKSFAGSPSSMPRDVLSSLVSERYDWDRVFSHLFCIYDEVSAQYPRT